MATKESACENVWAEYINVCGNDNEYAFFETGECASHCVCACQCAPPQSVINFCSCSVAALCRVSRQPGEYLLAGPSANHHSTLPPSFGAFDVLPFFFSLPRLPPCLSGSVPYLCVLAGRWRDGFASGHFYLPTFPALSQRGWWSYSSLFIQNPPIYFPVYICACYSLSRLSWEILVVIGPDALHNPFFFQIVWVCSFSTFHDKTVEVAFLLVFTPLGTRATGYLMCAGACL